MIFYFSGTGNTKWAATTLAKALGEELVDIGAYVYSDNNGGKSPFTLKKNERLGFCFPIHGWQPPGIVRRFLSLVQITACGNYCYAVCTCGDSIGEAMEIFKKDLDKRGLHLDASFTLIMPESYVALPFMYTDTLEREQEKKMQAEKDLVLYTEMIMARRREEHHLVKGPTPWFFTYVVGGYFNRFMISDKKFTVDDDVCIGCGKCAKSCPVGNIVMKEGRPDWKHDNSCTSCLACYHHCPHHAINYGNITRKRGQYYYMMRG